MRYTRRQEWGRISETAGSENGFAVPEVPRHMGLSRYRGPESPRSMRSVARASGPWLRQVLAVALLLLPAAARAWLADEPAHLLCTGLGVAEVLDKPRFCTWNVELRPAWSYRHLHPWFFIGTGKHDTCYAAAGVLADFALGERWRLTPSFGVGYYNSSGLTLGHHAEFRSGIEISRRFRNGQRLGLAFAHLSNGSLGDRNPGTETLGLFWALPLDALAGRRE